MSMIKKIGQSKDTSIKTGFRYSFEFDSRLELETYVVNNGIDSREDIINGLAQQFKLALRETIYGK